MRIEYDKEADAVYIYIVSDIKEGEAKKTLQLNDDIILDFDKNEKLLDIEVLNASKHLSKDILLEEA
ncbi:MAG TPA: DUF2283 domain-containing protein [Candidatus Nanoarchaeia archaeon]|nr:DUF2283 domain-containing protein [Candidatus Nanoarchaeia archaeon]